MRFLQTFLICFALWLVLSGQLDAFHLSFGVISAAVVAAYSAELLFPERAGRPLVMLRWIAYLPFLVWQILLSNRELLKIVFHPRLMEKIDPVVIQFRTGLRGDLARMNLANAITLTPGTLTVRIDDDTFWIHCLTPAMAQGLPETFEVPLCRVFGEDDQPAGGGS